jgi:hypothetical protein
MFRGNAVRMLARRLIIPIGLFASSACGSSESARDAVPSAEPAPSLEAPGGIEKATASREPTRGDARTPSGPAPAPTSAPSAASRAWQFHTRVITTDHRAIPGQQFGGWGPHLGHLVRLGGDLFWVDDACGPGTCDVHVDARVDYFKVAPDHVTRVATVALPGGVQQNTGTVADGTTVWTYGVAVAGKYLAECAFIPGRLEPACNALPLDIGDSANYVGAAIHPMGTRVAWLTNVVDGGGGSFRYYANFGSGWNGPRLGAIGGYNDASYINVAFADRRNPGRFTMLAELVSGLAPNWTNTGGIGEGNLSDANAVTWSVAGSLPHDPTISTADILIDSASGDTHVLARAKSGALVYLHRGADGRWSAPVKAADRSFLARFVVVGDPSVGRLFVVHDVQTVGAVVREFARALGPLDWGQATPTAVPLPAGYASLDAIYPETTTYQTSPVQGVNFAVVGAARENEILAVFAEPPAR